MVLKDDWETGDPFSADDANDVATQVNANTTAIEGKADAGDVPDALTDLDTTVTGAELDAIKSKVDGIEAGADVTGSTIHGATGKTTPVDADELALIDSAASNVLKKLTWANLKATIKSYYDSVAATLTNKDLTSGTNTFPTFNQNTTGSAATLTTSRTFQTNLASTSTASFNGSANVTPGVTGTLAVGNGGTGATSLTGLVKGNGTSAFTAASAGTDYYAPGGTDVALGDGGTGASLTDPNADRIMFWDDSAGAVTWLAPDGTNLAISGTTLNIGSGVYRSGGTDVALGDGGTGASLSDPNADRIMFWDDSAGTVTWLAPDGTNLVISGTTIDVASGIAAWRSKTAPSGTPVGTSDTQTLTNKTITKRVATVTSNATPTLNTDNCDAFNMTLSTTITSFSTNLSGTPTDWQPLLGRITASGGDHGITLGSSWNDVGGDFPTTIPSGKTLTLGAYYNSGTSKWDVLAWKLEE